MDYSTGIWGTGPGTENIREPHDLEPLCEVTGSVSVKRHIFSHKVTENDQKETQNCHIEMGKDYK